MSNFNSADIAAFKDVWVFCEQREGKLMPTDFELISKGRDLADELGVNLCGLLLGGEGIENVAKELGGYGADKVIVCESPLLATYTTDGYAKVICDVIEDLKPEAFLIGATNIGRDLGPRCAARLHTGLCADCTHLDVDVANYIQFLRESSTLDVDNTKWDMEDRNLKMTRPAFGGHLMATIICPRFRPCMATVRPGVMKKNAFDEAKAKEYRDAAIEELTAQGVTFPIKVQLPYNPSSTDWDKQCQVLKQQLEGVLNDGTDFIDIIITAGPSDSFLSAVRRNGKFEFLLCNWGADYSDPETETDPFYQAKDSRGMRYAYLRTGVEDGFITGETADAVMAYMNAIEAAKQITDDIDARYKAFADAETLLITNALVIPRGMSVPAYLATRLNYWEGQYASTGFSNKRLKGIHVLDHYISMDEYEANRDAR